MLGCKSNSVNHFNSKFSLEICHLEKIYNFCLGDDGYLQTPGILGDCFCCTMMWWDWNCLLRIAIGIASSGLRLGLPPQDCGYLQGIASSGLWIASSGLRLPPGLPPQDCDYLQDCLLRMLDLVPPRIKVFFYDKVTFCSCLIQRCWTRVPLHSSLSPQGVNLGRQFVKLTWQ